MVRGSLLLGLSLAGFLLVVASSLSYQIEWIPPVELGLFALLPAGYWAGMALVLASIALGLRQGGERLFLCQTLLLYLVIWGAPVLYLRQVDVWDSYMHFFSSLEIAQEGSALAQGIFSYSGNYPGFFIVGSTFNILGQPDALLFLKLYPLFVAAFTLLATYLLVRTYLPGWDYRFALLVCLLGNVWMQFNYSPQSLGLAVGLLVFVFLEKEGLRWLLLALAAFIYVVVSHPTTTFFVVAGLVVREVWVFLKDWRARRKGWGGQERPWPLVAFLVVWVGWLFTGAREYSGFLWETIYRKLAYIFLVPEATGQAVGQRTVGNIFFLGPYLRLALLGALLFFLLLAVLHWLRSRRRRVLPGGLLAMAFVPIIVIPLDIFLLQGQVYDRGFLFIALAAPILITLIYFRRWTNWHKLAAALIAMATVVCCASTFYQQSLYTVSERSLGMSEFLDEHVQRGTSIIGGTYPDLVWRDSNWTQFIKVKYFEVYDEPFENITRDRGASGMIFDRTTELWQTQYGQLFIYDFYRDNITRFSKVYESGAYCMIYGGEVRR